MLTIETSNDFHDGWLAGVMRLPKRTDLTGIRKEAFDEGYVTAIETDDRGQILALRASFALPDGSPSKFAANWRDDN